MLIAGDRPAGESLPQAFTLFFRDHRFQLRREHDRQRLGVAPAVKAVDSLRMAVCIRKIRLDVIDRRAVHQIGARDIQDRAVLRMKVGLDKLHAGKPQRVRPERRTRSEHAHARLAAQLRRQHCRRPACARDLIKLPDEPQMRKIRNAAQTVRIAVRQLEHDRRDKPRRQP